MNSFRGKRLLKIDMGNYIPVPKLYKIYYDDVLVYLGRTKQPLQTRLRGHFFKKQMHRVIDIQQVSRIEYAEFATVADMYLYEIYYINLLKPTLNCDDCAQDALTVSLPDVEFIKYDPPLLEKWKEEIKEKDSEINRMRERLCELPQLISVLRKRKANGEITEDEYWNEKMKLTIEEKELSKKLYGR